ncbi:MAG: rhodanese-related sulfurtransferase [Patescibacteria group bacterium]
MQTVQATQVLLFYKYVTVEDPETFSSWLRDLATEHGLLGRILVAEEGLNGTVEGSEEDTEAFATALLEDERFSDMQVKRSAGNGNAFPKLSVKVREEIVGTRFPKQVDPRVRTAPRIAAEELRSWYENGKEFVIVDMRNDYEYRSGHFKDSVNPGLENSRDLPGALPKLDHLKDKTVLTVCTGGVRCEKMSALLLEEGFADVYQLDNGIHGYMEKYPGQDFEGALYTFDDRKTMDFGGDRDVVGRCTLCAAPAELYANCANDLCHDHFIVCETCSGGRSVFCSAAC